MQILLIFVCLTFTLGAIFIMIKEGFSWETFGSMVFFGIGAFIFIFQKKWDRWTNNLIKMRIESTHCLISNDHIYFPRGYYFKYGYLKNSKKLPFNVINDIRTNTHPISAKVNNNEIIFLLGLEKRDIELLQSKAHIPVITPQDNWSLICEEFLDTEPDEKEKEYMLDLLENSGISREEVKKIRKRIQKRMLIKTYFTWEWIYYGQYDVLKELWPLNQKKYWWTMDIALRNKKS